MKRLTITIKDEQVYMDMENIGMHDLLYINHFIKDTLQDLIDVNLDHNLREIIADSSMTIDE